jgi:hypothetical protein
MINAYNQVTLKLSIEISALGSNVGTVTDPQFAIKDPQGGHHIDSV